MVRNGASRAGRAQMVEKYVSSRRRHATLNWRQIAEAKAECDLQATTRKKTGPFVMRPCTRRPVDYAADAKSTSCRGAQTWPGPTTRPRSREETGGSSGWCRRARRREQGTDDSIPNTTGPTLCGLHHPSSAVPPQADNAGRHCRSAASSACGHPSGDKEPGPGPPPPAGSPPQLPPSPLAVAVRVNRERPVVGPWRKSYAIASSQGVKGRERKVGVGQSKRAEEGVWGLGVPRRPLQHLHPGWRPLASRRNCSQGWWVQVRRVPSHSMKNEERRAAMGWDGVGSLWDGEDSAGKERGVAPPVLGCVLGRCE